MEDKISVNFHAQNPSDIKFLNRLYDSHLVLNDIAVRLDDQLNNADEELTVPNQEDIQNLSQTFNKTVTILNDIIEKYNDLDSFIANFGDDTEKYAKNLVTELVEFNDGIADIGDTNGGLENYDDDKLNNWINAMMNHIVDTNDSFKKLVNE